MNELFDKLIIRLIFALFICLLVFLYRLAHKRLYPSTRRELLIRFNPSKNGADSFHLFGRILGMGIIFSEFTFYLGSGMTIALIDFFLLSSVAFICYLASIYILESIVLYNFEYEDEILKRKNISYAVISFTLTVGVAMVIKSCLQVSKHAIVIFFFLWLFSIVVISLATKSFHFFSKLPFNRLLIQKNLSLALSYTGFFTGWSLILCAALNHELKEIRWYILMVLIKIALSLIILPIFKRGLIFIFLIQDEYSIEEDGEPEIGHGIYEGVIFLTSCLLTIVIAGHINFGSFYPIFSAQ